jgi:hypothetical protein
MNQFNAICPACSHNMIIREYECPQCSTTVRGRFHAGSIHGLSREQFEFVKTFLRCRGNIREVERELGISYPTVRNRLDSALRALGLAPAKEETASEERAEILDRLEKGEIDAEAAARLLSGKKAHK